MEFRCIILLFWVLINRNRKDYTGEAAVQKSTAVYIMLLNIEVL